MLQFSDDKLIQGLISNDSVLVNHIYREFFPMVRSIVCSRYGNQEDAEDVFHDALLVVHNRVRSSAFILDCSFKTFLFSVCRNIWRRRLERKNRLMYISGSERFESDGKASVNEDEEYNYEKYRLFRKHFQELPEFCRNLLGMYIEKLPMAEIARKLNYKDADYVKARKYYCKAMLRDKIKNDPLSKEFMNYE
jgi:RNA polymerase sigma factor (sigma-70 family)